MRTSWLLFMAGTWAMAACGGGEVPPGAEPDGAPTQTLLRARPEPAGEHCPSGGVAIESGQDVDRDGALGDDEVASTAYVCNGLPGDVDPTLCRDGLVLEGTFAILDADDLATFARVVCIKGNLV